MTENVKILLIKGGIALAGAGLAIGTAVAGTVSYKKSDSYKYSKQAEKDDADLRHAKSSYMKNLYENGSNAEILKYAKLENEKEIASLNAKAAKAAAEEASARAELKSPKINITNASNNKDSK